MIKEDQGVQWLKRAPHAEQSRNMLKGYPPKAGNPTLLVLASIPAEAGKYTPSGKSHQCT
eukprot:2374721-Prorocentrum_lima.AAC.1